MLHAHLSCFLCLGHRRLIQLLISLPGYLSLCWPGIKRRAGLLKQRKKQVGEFVPKKGPSPKRKSHQPLFLWDGSLVFQGSRLSRFWQVFEPGRKWRENTGSTSHTQQDLYGISREIKPSPLKRTPVCPKKRTKKTTKKIHSQKGHSC